VKDAKGLFSNLQSLVKTNDTNNKTQINTRYQEAECDQTTVQFSMNDSDCYAKYDSHEISEEMLNYNVDTMSDILDTRNNSIVTKRYNIVKQKEQLDNSIAKMVAEDSSSDSSGDDLDVSEVPILDDNIHLVTRSIFRQRYGV